MGYIVLDTCVWIDLLKAPLGTKFNLFNEFVFWFERGHLKSVTCENIKKEWDRTKSNQGVISAIINVHKADLHRHPDNTTTTDTDFISNSVQARIEKIDYILNEKSIIAQQNDSILLTAANRSIYKQGPCHKKDSFLDALNIYSVIEHLKGHPVEPIWFSTINYSDFSETDGKRHLLHPDLVVDFTGVNLQYLYYDDRNSANTLMTNTLRPALPSYMDYLKEQQKIEDESSIALMISPMETPNEIDESEYIKHLDLIDLIVSRENPSSLELNILEMITASHSSYKQYFLKKLSAK